MHDLQLIGVHDDGEHLVLGDGEGQRYLLGVDEALRAAVRRDRAALGQLQIEIGGGLRPREVQARIRSGATAEQIAAASGWPIEKIRRYEGPVLAEREHVAALAREVRLRRPGSGQVTLGTEVVRRLTGRGVDPDVVRWDSWRADDGPWTVVVHFSAGGRERQARWHFDLGGRSVTPADDEARWLSEQVPDAEGPLGGSRLAAVPDAGLRPSGVYDIEADGGVEGVEAASGSFGTHGDGHPLDLMTAMRSRRKERDQRSPRRGHGAVTPTDVPGATHPARRRRAPRPEPLELDPTLLADPPAAHPPASEVAHLEVPQLELEAHPTDQPTERSAEDPPPARRWPLAGVELVEPDDVDDDGDDDGDDEVVVAPEPADDVETTDELLAHDLRVEEPVDHVSDDVADDSVAVAEGPAEPAADGPEVDLDADELERAEAGRHRGASRSRGRRASVPSWDDIMFGAKRD